MAAILAAGRFLATQNKNYFIQAAVPENNNTVSVVAAPAPQISPVPTPLPPPQKLANPPAIIKSVYMTGYSAGSKSYLNYLDQLFRNTQINAVVVDVKGSSGYVSYDSQAENVLKYNLSDREIPDIDALVRFFHDRNIYVIGRIAVFEDPVFAKARPDLAVYSKSATVDLSHPVLWKDNNRIAWVDPASKDVWDYDVSLAKDALYNGFDEINFDYVRFPTDGNAGNMGFPIYDGKTPKADVITNFFQYARANLSDAKISVDLFGLTTVDTDDMGIGQIIENALQNFDYVCPMVYPSHYANGFIGFANPADHPYEVVKYSMDHALAKINNLFASGPAIITLGKLRPWLQDFNMGAFYTAPMVSNEIQAIQDSLATNYSGFMLWNPNNIYTQGAVLK